MAFSAIYDLVIDDRDVRIYSNGTGDPVLMVPDLAPPTAEISALAAAVYDSLVDVQTALARSWDAAPPATE